MAQLIYAYEVLDLGAWRAEPVRRIKEWLSLVILIFNEEAAMHIPLIIEFHTAIIKGA